MTIQKVYEIDLEPILVKIIYEKGWSLDKARVAEQAYRRFLHLVLEYPQENITVNKLVDDFWHQHILDTRKYAEDCEYIFGFFLHHFPYFGMRGEEDRKNLSDAAEKTRTLYAREFGENPSECDETYLDISYCTGQEQKCVRLCTPAEESCVPPCKPGKLIDTHTRPRLADVGTAAIHHC